MSKLNPDGILDSVVSSLKVFDEPPPNEEEVKEMCERAFDFGYRIGEILSQRGLSIEDSLPLLKPMMTPEQ